MVPVGVDDVSPVVLPMFHLYGLLVTDQCLLMGSKIILFETFDDEAFLKAVEDHKISVGHLVPPILLRLSNHPRANCYDTKSIRRIVTAAAPLLPEIRKRFITTFSDSNNPIDVFQAYGLTEVSVTHFNLPKSERPSGKTGTIGVLGPNIKCKVVDPVTEKELEANKNGEIVIQGPTLMKGYLNNIKATEETLRNEWLYTGDIGYYDEDGFFYCTDRKKELIKYKGFQVAPAELEEVLLSHPGVADCAVVPRQRESDGEELATAFVVKKKKEEMLKEKDLVDFVAGKVVHHKQIKGGVVFVDAIPKTASGKILRRLLKERLAYKN